jgi:hypothetical protein
MPVVSSWLPYLRPTWPGTVGDGATIDLATIHEDLSEPHYLAGPVWQEVDEQVIPLEQRRKLAEHGLRVGVVNLAASAELQKLLTREDRCSARRLSARSSEETAWLLDKKSEPIDLVLPTGRQRLVDPHFLLKVRVRTNAEGRTVVRLEPAVQHGQASYLPRPREDQTGWEVDRRPPEIRFSELALEITLGPHDLVVIGSSGDQVDSLGHFAFTDRATNRRRVLVIRPVVRPVAAVPLAVSGPIPLALQTLWSGQQPYLAANGH